MTPADAAQEPPGRPLARGSTAEVRRLPDGRVLKLFKTRIPAEQVAAEATALARAHAAGLPVPALHGTACHAGRQGLTLQELTGASALRALIRRPYAATRLLARMAELQVRLNALPGDGLPDQTARLRAAIDRAELPAALRRAVLARLSASDTAGALCHGDFHLGNLIVQAGTLYVLDWDKACRGTPAADAARTAVMLRDGKLGGIADTALAGPVRAVLARAYVGAYVRAYTRRTGEPGIADAIAWWLPVATAAKLPFVAAGRRRRVLKRLTRMLSAET